MNPNSVLCFVVSLMACCYFAGSVSGYMAGSEGRGKCAEYARRAGREQEMLAVVGDGGSDRG